MAAAISVWPSDTFPVPSVCGTERRRESLWAPGEQECVCVCVRLHFYVDLMFTQRVPACVWIIQSCSYTHTHFAIPVAPRLCCQPLLLICTRQAGKNPNLSAALHLFCITISLLLCLLLLFNPSSLQCLRFHVFRLFLPAIRLCLSLSHTHSLVHK